jgi:two-component system, OmpR family, sensor histidine kinase BaeS
MSTSSRRVPGPLRDLPIFWKLLLPFLVLLLVVGSAGAFVIVRDLAQRSANALDEELTVRAIDARSLLHESELDLLESANYASNVEGMTEAMSRRDGSAATALLQSVIALKPGLKVVVATDDEGRGLAELGASGVDWSAAPPVREAIAAGGTRKVAGFVRAADRTLLVMVAPICAGAPCSPVGYAVVAEEAPAVAARIVAVATEGGHGEEDVTLYDLAGTVLTSTGRAPGPSTPGEGDVVQRRHDGLATSYTTFTLAGQRAGTVAVTIPAESAFTSVRGPAGRLIGLLLLAMGAAVALGAAISRLITRQLRALVQTSRALGAGDLSARAPVLSADEHGELAKVLNQMAEQLEAERASLEMQVEQRTEEIRLLLRDRTEFFAGLSHELRTPLAVIATQAEMLRDKQAADAIGVSAAQLLALINDILDLARAEAGSIDLHTESMSVAVAFDALATMVVRLGTAADVKVRVTKPGRLPAVKADPARLHQILVNLVDNAIKYTPSGGRVEVSAEREADHVRVTVLDTGVGIPEEVGDRVFEPFYRVPSTHPQRNQASSGLGLALARRTIEAHGGTIEWHARPEGGTAFSFTLPLARVSKRGKPLTPTNGHHAADHAVASAGS